MNFDPDLALKLAGFAMSIGTMIYVFFATRRHDVDEKFKEGSKKFSDLELRVQLLEVAVQSLPQKDDMHALALTLAEINGEMKAMRAVMRAMSDSMTRTESIVMRHDEYLLGEGKS